MLACPVAIGVAALAGRIGTVTAAPTAKGRTRPVGYADMVRRWHELPTRAPEQTPDGREALVFEMINTSERVELTPLGEEGGFTDQDLDRANYALRDPHTDNHCTMNERVLNLAYRLQLHFSSKAIRIVSAYRSRSRSNHGKGRALDLVVPGAPDSEVAHYAESLGFVGVGLYPISGFVHVDSRPRSYFWIDRSGPGQHNKMTAILANVAAASDKRALARGEEPPDESDSDEESANAATPSTQEPSTGKDQP